MSFFVAGAVVVGAGVSAYSSNKASKENSKNIKKGLDQAESLASQAREDVMGLFERSSRNSALGLKGAMEFYRTAAPKRMTPFLQANQQAQAVIGQGAQQANNAILGLPVDMAFTQQTQVQPDMNYMLGAELPDYSEPPESAPAEPDMSPATPAAKKPGTTDMLKEYKPSNQLKKHQDKKKNFLKKLF